MDKTFIQLAEQAEAEIAASKVEIDKQKKGLDLRTGRVKQRERNVTEKEKQLGEWEKALNAKYEEISRMENAKFLEMKANQQNNSAEIKLSEARELVKKGEADMAEAKAMQAEILERETKCTIREKDMRKRIKNEVAQGLLAGFMKQ